MGPGSSNLTLRVLSVEPLTQPISTKTPFEDCISFVEAILYDVSNPDITYKDVLKVDWDRETFNSKVSLGVNFEITGTYSEPTSDQILDFSDAPHPILSLTFPELPPEPKPIDDLVGTDLTIGKNYHVRLNFSTPLNPEQIILKTSIDMGKTWKEREIKSNEIHFDSKGVFLHTYPLEGGLHLFQLVIIGGLNEGISNLVTVELPPTKPENSTDPDDSQSGSRGPGGRDEAVRDPHGNILENLVEHDYLLDEDVVTAESLDPQNNAITTKKESSLPNNENSSKSNTLKAEIDSTSEEANAPFEIKHTKGGFITFLFAIFLIILLIFFFIKRKKISKDS